jgi:hypothetical protein
VPVWCMQGKIVLQDERRQPHVVRRNRCALFPELAKDQRVVVGRLVVREEHADALLQEKPPERSLVLGLPTPVSKAGSKLAEHHERQHDGLCLLEERHRFVDAFAEVDAAIRIESNPHRQRSSSTRS